MEWKKVKFMERRIGDDFDGLSHQRDEVRILRGTHRPLRRGPGSAQHANRPDRNDRYTYHEDTRQIIGQRSRKTYSMGDRVRVLVDRVDPVEKKIQFAVLEEQPKSSGKSPQVIALVESRASPPGRRARRPSLHRRTV